jgi:hypothetical protein
MPDTRWICPDCGEAGLAGGLGIELPPDSWSDEISLGPISCTLCAFRGIGVYQESRRGRLDSESWQHAGYPAAGSLCDALQQSINLCPDAGKKNCTCPTHQMLGTTDANGAWNWLKKNGIDMARRFLLRKA